MTKPSSAAQKQPDPSYIVYKSRKRLAVDNLIGGISWGVGSVVGATLVITIIGFILAQTTHVPLLGTLVQSVMDEVARQQLQKN